MSNSTPEGIRRFNYLLGELDATYHDIALKFALSDSAMHILYTLCDEGTDCPLSEICRRCGLSKQTVNSAIRKLEAEGILYLQKTGSKGKIVFIINLTSLMPSGGISILYSSHSL